MIENETVAAALMQMLDQENSGKEDYMRHWLNALTQLIVEADEEETSLVALVRGNQLLTMIDDFEEAEAYEGLLQIVAFIQPDAVIWSYPAELVDAEDIDEQIGTFIKLSGLHINGTEIHYAIVKEDGLAKIEELDYVLDSWGHDLLGIENKITH